MKIKLRIAALLARAGYSLSRYKFLFIPLDALTLAVLFVAPLYIGWRGWRRGFGPWAWLGIAACGLSFAVFVFVRSKRYLFFEPDALEASGSGALLRAEEKLQIRGTGLFAVGGRSRQFVDAPALFWITELGEYVVMAYNRVRALPLLDSPVEEQGMWYIFLKPADIISVTTGRLCYGLSRRQTVEIRYRMPDGAEAMAYLTCDTLQDHGRLASELVTRSGTAAGPPGSDDADEAS